MYYPKHINATVIKRSQFQIEVNYLNKETGKSEKVIQHVPKNSQYDNEKAKKALKLNIKKQPGVVNVKITESKF